MNDDEIMLDTEFRIANGQIDTIMPQGLLHYLQRGNETPNSAIRNQILQKIYKHVIENTDGIIAKIDADTTMELNEKNKQRSVLDAILRGYAQNTFNKGHGSNSFKKGGKKSRRQKSRKSRLFRRSQKARR